MEAVMPVEQTKLPDENPADRADPTQPGDFPVCEAVAARTIALPFHHAPTQQDVNDVCREPRQLL